ncbi:hypothetical protein CPB85DRAFT_1439970 [Mucidula mucida]|nr:hypothetical protein CPB85DRAFT_1439970 [Mucidula mucida]
MPYAPQLSQSAHPDWNTAQGMSQYYPSFLLENQSNYEAFRRDISWLGAFCDDIIRDLTAKGYTCRPNDSNLASSSSSLTRQTHWTSPSISPPSLFENLQVSGTSESDPLRLIWPPIFSPSTPVRQPSPTSLRSQYGHSPHDNASFASPAADISEEYNIRPLLSPSSHASSTHIDSHSQPTRGRLPSRSVYPTNRQSTRRGSDFNGMTRPRGPSPLRRAAHSVPPQASSSSHQNFNLSHAQQLPRDSNGVHRSSDQLFASAERYHGTTQLYDGQPYQSSPQPLYSAALPRTQDDESSGNFAGSSALGWISPTPPQPESLYRSHPSSSEVTPTLDF